MDEKPGNSRKSCQSGKGSATETASDSLAARRQEFLEPMTPEGAKEFADRWLLGESGSADALLVEAAQHIYSLLGLLPRDSARDGKWVVPVKIAGHWENARVHVDRGDLLIDIPAGLVRLVEADHPGRGQRFGYQLLIERLRIAELFREDLRRLDETRGDRDA